MTTTPNPTPTPAERADAARAALADAERYLVAARKAAKDAERYLANAIRDAVALSFKRDLDGLDRYDEADLRNLGRLAIRANLERQRERLRRASPIRAVQIFSPRGLTRPRARPRSTTYPPPR